MKKILFNVFSLTSIILISLFSTGCGSSSPTPTPCSTTNTLFQQLYNNVATAAGNSNTNTMDTYVHGYDFNVTANKVICSVGYQSQPGVAGQLYKIEIIDNTTSTTLFNANSTFSSTTTSYLSVPNINVVVGHNYTIRRTLLNDLGNVMNRIGRLTTSPSFSLTFPYSLGVLNITGSHFNTTSTVSNFGLPFIDIVFQ